jgi:predicted transcriptional regulator
MSTLTIRLDTKLERQLNRLARQTRRSKSELVRQMLRKQLALASLEQARASLVPLAERAGYLTDEDVFRDIS